MNTKLVKRLISEATTPGGREGLGGCPSYELDEELLIELVVKECVTISQEIALSHQWKGDVYNAGRKAGAFECAEKINKHFGVE